MGAVDSFEVAILAWIGKQSPTDNTAIVVFNNIASYQCHR
jgi:hypothetical protein